MVFIKLFNGSKFLFQVLHESSNVLLLPLFFLFLGSILLGFFFNDFFIGFGNSVLFHARIMLLNDSFLFETDLIFSVFKLGFFVILFLFSSGVIAFFFNILGMFCYRFIKDNTFSRFISMYFFLFNTKWFFDSFYNRYIYALFFSISFQVSYNFFDKLLLERFFGHKNIFKFFLFLYNSTRLIFQIGTFANFFLFFFVIIFLFLSSLFLFL